KRVWCRSSLFRICCRLSGLFIEPASSSSSSIIVHIIGESDVRLTFRIECHLIVLGQITITAARPAFQTDVLIVNDLGNSLNLTERRVVRQRVGRLRKVHMPSPSLG